MNNLTPLTRPLQSQVTIEPIAKNCPSEGYNYPTFPQLNKQARVQFSQSFFTPEPSTSYRLFATANIKGWFVAVVAGSSSSSELIFSSLEHLRSAFTVAKEEQEVFIPKRTLPLAFGKANIVTFACHDTRLLLGLEQGAIAIYDTAVLFTSGSGDIQPLKMIQLQSGPLRQIVPNPGTEQNLSHLVVVVGDRKVALLDMQLEPQGGWTASDPLTQPVAVAWSPKGKHLAIGLQTGDILTFSLNNKSTPHKHLPPTADATLVSLNWLGPGHTFRTSYSAQSDVSPKQHIITLDTKSSTATYFAPDHPFPSFDRNQQSAYILCLPRWDEDASGEGNKLLIVVGDASSVDLEVLGSIGSEWYRQSQENPLTLPLDKSMDDTMLLALDVDLSAANIGTPIMYAYLNDGTLQGWQVKHSKPYIGMVSTQGLPSTFPQSSVQSQDSGSKDSDMGGLSSTTDTSPFAQLSGTDTPFGQQITSSFGQQQSNTFGQSPFGQQPSQNAPVFGQSSFGQFTQSGSPSTFSSASASGPFGQAGQTNNAASPFGSSAVKPSPGFGAFGNVSNGIFGSGSSGGPFSNLNSGTANVFGQGNFGANNVNSDSASPSHSSDMTREASMSDSTGGFGGMSLGSATPTNSNAVNSMFGTFAAAPVGAPIQSAFGGIVQPATGFGAFNNLKPSNNFEPNKSATTTSAFTAAPQAPTSSGFGQSGFASPAFGKSSFGQPAFGKPSLGTIPSTSAGGFAAFANTPATFGNPPAPAKTLAFISPETKAASSGTASGFSGFASGSPTTFGSALEASKSADGNKDSGGAFSAFASGTLTTFTSTLGAANISKPSGGGFSVFAAETPAAFATTPVASTTLENTPKASASAGGFASFASNSSTTPGTALKASESAARTSVFGTPTSSMSFSSTAESPFALPTIKPASFGDSALTRNTMNTPGGSPQSVFAISPPSSPEPGVRASSPYGNSNIPSTPPHVPTAPSSNAFSNIQVTPSAFKPSAGFGAFGSAVTPPTSPFFKKPDDKLPVSAFSNLLPQARSSTTPVSTHTFGSPSALGGPKSIFAPVSPPTPTVLKPTTSDGFGAFSGSAGGFSAFSGQKKSFSELLKTGDADPIKPSTPLAFSTPSSKDLPEEKTTPKATTSISGLPSMVSDSSSKKEDDAKDDKQTTPKSVFSALSAPSPRKVDKTGKGRMGVAVPADDNKRPLSTNEVVSSGTISDEPSYGTISGSSATSSFVDIKADQKSDADAEEDADDEGDDDINTFLSEDGSSDGSYEDQESAEESSATEDSETSDPPPPEPAAIPLPISRSPSATPQPEVPKIEVSPSPPSEEKYSQSSNLSPAREPSTTPPGTPAKEPKPLIGSSPSLSGNAPIPSPFGIGLGRPSTRPTRSSPLANAVLSGHDDEEEDKLKSSQPTAVAPKSVFNIFPVKAQTGSSEGQPSDKRPKTPPLLSTMGGSSFFASASSGGAPGPSAASAESSLAKVNTPVSLPFSFQKPAAMASSPDVFGKALSTGPSPSIPDIQRPASTPAPTQPSFFGTPSLASAIPSPSPSMFNVPPVNPKTLTTTTTLTSAPQGPVVIKPLVFPLIPTPTKSTSGPSTSMGPPSFFATPSQLTPPPQSTTFKAPPADLFASSSAFSVPQKPPAATAAQVALEEGMQKECIYSVALADKELEEMSVVVNNARKKYEEVGTSRGGSRNRCDLSDPSKWGLSDLAQFGQALRQYEEELDNLAAENETKTQALREIQSNILKAGTRREEIARFTRAKTDQEFAKTLKARTLGPEHSETQMQLRKYIRLVHDRVQKLETGLLEKKKKLAESISGKPSFKAPSLDTINRSYQNIDRIIRERSDQVSDLTARISKLNVKDVAASPQQEPPLGYSRSGRPYNVTPDVAVTTAAALNAERSAQRLKKALLAVRKEPLLNTKATSSPNVKLNTPQKPSNQSSAFPALLPPSPTSSSSASMLDWTSFPEDKFNPNASPLPQSRRGGSGQRKHPSVPLKRSTGPSEASTSTPVAASFDWGPLPTFPSPGTAKTTMPTAFVPISTTFKTPPKK